MFLKNSLRKLFSGIPFCSSPAIAAGAAIAEGAHRQLQQLEPPGTLYSGKTNQTTQNEPKSSEFWPTFGHPNLLNWTYKLL